MGTQWIPLIGHYKTFQPQERSKSSRSEVHAEWATLHPPTLREQVFTAVERLLHQLKCNCAQPLHISVIFHIE